eukprot:1184278-Prorocentrum_minimum.AAC.3
MPPPSPGSYVGRLHRPHAHAGGTSGRHGAGRERTPLHRGRPLLVPPIQHERYGLGFPRIQRKLVIHKEAAVAVQSCQAILVMMPGKGRSRRGQLAGDRSDVQHVTVPQVRNHRHRQQEPEYGGVYRGLSQKQQIAKILHLDRPPLTSLDDIGPRGVLGEDVPDSPFRAHQAAAPLQREHHLIDHPRLLGLVASPRLRIWIVQDR